MAREVAIVPHTHWDREWYEPFQAFRLKLVDLLDTLLPLLEADPGYAHFLLDGQMAAVDDYLAVRPKAESRLSRLVSSGRIAIGPWYVLPDELCVSGETLVRNVQLGLARAEELGGAMPVGYLPDTFGHTAQMPQLLRLAGFDHAVVWRGVPLAVDRTAFRWSAPDGSTVRAEYLPVGYGNGAAVPDDPARLVTRVRAHEAELGSLLAADSALLWMNGTDHQVPQPWLGRVVAQANQLQDDYHLVVTSLPDHLNRAAASSAPLPSWTGELRSGARANLLPGVASNHVDVKQAAARTERALERRAEPLCALFLTADLWPRRALEIAWLEVLRNAAHDSSCACAADEVVEAVLGRYREARQVAHGLGDRALAALGASMAIRAPVVVNPSARARCGIVELVLAVEPGERTQLLAARPAAAEEHAVAGAELGTMLGQAANRAMALGGRVCGAEVEDRADGLAVVVRTGPADAVEPGLASDLAEIHARVGARPDGRVQVRIEHLAFWKVLARAEEVPGYGWKAWAAGVGGGGDAAWAGDGSLANTLVQVDVDPEDGTFAIDGSRGLDLLVDSGDAGDTYNYSPPSSDRVVDRPVAVTVAVAESGPIRAALEVTRTFAWPEGIVAGARAGEREVVVTTRLELHAGERLVRLTTSFENWCRDHRLRAVFPLPRRATGSRAECAFDIVERPLGPGESGPHERGLATHPSRRFVAAGGLTVVHEGLLEYEVVDDGRALALTLLRGVGILSGADLAYRPLPAGPPLPLPGAQLQGPRVFRYGVAVDPPGAALDPYALVDDAFLPLEVVSGSGAGTRPPSGSALTVEGAEVSAVRRAGGLLELRVFNPTDRETTVRLAGRSGWLVDLRHQPLAPFSGEFRLRAHGIATALLGSGTSNGTENAPFEVPERWGEAIRGGGRTRTGTPPRRPWP